jgi:hypothetical protein
VNRRVRVFKEGLDWKVESAHTDVWCGSWFTAMQNAYGLVVMGDDLEGGPS